jgi:hypothetical protein
MIDCSLNWAFIDTYTSAQRLPCHFTAKRVSFQTQRDAVEAFQWRNTLAQAACNVVRDQRLGEHFDDARIARTRRERC